MRIRTPILIHNTRHDSRLLLLLGLTTNVLENLVHLFECLAGGLGDAEEGEDEC